MVLENGEFAKLVEGISKSTAGKTTKTGILGGTPPLTSQTPISQATTVVMNDKFTFSVRIIRSNV